jgi:hypothetical protein
MSRKRLAVLVAIVEVWTLSAASGDVCLYTTNVTGENALYLVNPMTAGVQRVGSFGVEGFMSGLAHDAGSGVMYGVTSATNRLYRINVVTGAAALIGGVGVDPLHGLAFNRADGYLYAVYGNQSLYRIDPLSASTTVVGALGVDGLVGLDFDAAGRLIACLGGQNLGAGGLYEVSTVTGAATLLVNTTRLQSIAFHPLTGVLYGVDNGGSSTVPSSLYTIHPVTGAASVIGVMPLDNTLGLEFVPAPSAAWVVGVASWLWVGRRRSKSVR